MNKLAKKFILGITLILIFAIVSIILINQNYVAKYYVGQKKDELNQISSQFIKELEHENFGNASQKIEDSEKVAVVKAEKNKNNEALNMELRDAFNKKNIGFKKLWLWDQDYDNVIKGREVIKLYEQDKLNYSVLVKYFSDETEIYAMGMIVPNIKDSFYIINTFFALIMSLVFLLSLVLLVVLVRRIVQPLNQFEVFAKNISKGKFEPLTVVTHDELENVATTLNEMGEEIISYQAALTEKNQKMEELLNNVAHDLKTPVSLIKLYSEGIKDDLDDGTFLDTIIDQSNEMNQMIERLLEISRIDTGDVIKESFNVSVALDEIINQISPLLKERNIRIKVNIEKDIWLFSQREWVISILSNLISNGIKYTSNEEIELSLIVVEEIITFVISNETDNSNLEINRIWEPYYVGEKSRSKELSGSGLGLYHVKKMVNQLGFIIEAQKKMSCVRIQVSMGKEDVK